MRPCNWFLLMATLCFFLTCSVLSNGGALLAQTTIDDVELGDDPEGDGSGDGAPSGTATSSADEAVGRVPDATDTDVDADDFTKLSATPGGANIETVIDLDTEVLVDSLLLEWSESIGATAYNVYRDTTAYFTPDRTDGTNRIATGITDQNTDSSGVQWTDTGVSGDVVGDPDTQYFYVVTGTDDQSNEGFNSNRAGEYDFGLDVDFNFITVPVAVDGLEDAEDLGLAIDDQVGGDGGDAIYRMQDGSWQLMAFKTGGAWVLAVTDAIEVGRALLVNMNDAGTWTAAGGLQPDAADTLEVGFNTIMLKFKKADDEAIEDAQDLGESIDAGASGDGATAIYRMESGSWQLMAFKSSGAWVLAVTDAVVPGRPYLVNMSEEVVW